MTEDPDRVQGITLDRNIRVGKYLIVFFVIFTVTALLVDIMVISKASCQAPHQYDPCNVHVESLEIRNSMRFTLASILIQESTAPSFSCS